ncbi:MAG: TonB-dependent receptor [bacterium]
MKKSVRKVMLCLLLFSVAVTLSAQTTKITGKVIDSDTWKPLICANIIIEGTGMGAFTDNKGNFSMNIEPGKYNITASMIGYKTEKLEIVISEGENTLPDIKLKTTALQMQEVVVTASRVPTKVFNAAAAVSVVNESKVKAPENNSVCEALRNISGVQLCQYGESNVMGGSWGFSMRGWESSRGVFLVDGIPQTGGQIANLPFEAVDRIEVIKGPCGALYGKNSLGGVVQVITKAGTEENQITANTGYETVTGTKKLSLTASGPLNIGKNSTFAVTGGIRAADGWQTRTDTASGAKAPANSKIYDFYTHLEIGLTQKDKLKVLGGYDNGYQAQLTTIWVDSLGKRITHYFPDRGTNYSIPNRDYIYQITYRLGTIWTHNFNSTTSLTSTISGWQKLTEGAVGRLRGFSPKGDTVYRWANNSRSNGCSGFGETQFQKQMKIAGNTLTLTAGANCELKPSQSYSQSIQYKSSSYIPLDINTLVEPSPTNYVYAKPTYSESKTEDYGVYLQSNLTLLKIFELEAGIRHCKYNQYKISIPSGIIDTFSQNADPYRVGLLCHLLEKNDAKINVYGSCGQGFSPQQGVTDTNLIKPEITTSKEAGIKSRFFGGILSLNLAVYDDIRRGVKEINPATNTYENAIDQEVKGFEIDVSIRPGSILSGFELFGTFTEMDPRVLHDKFAPEGEGKYLYSSGPFSALQLWSIGIGYSNKLISGEITNHYTGTSYYDAANIIKFPGYNLIDADIALHFGMFAFSVFGKNLLDTEYCTASYGPNVFTVDGHCAGAAFEGLPRRFGTSLSYGFK